MALVSGPGRGGVPGLGTFPQERTFVVEKHVDYIKGLDTVRRLSARLFSNGISLMTWAEEGRA